MDPDQEKTTFLRLEWGEMEPSEEIYIYIYTYYILVYELGGVCALMHR